METKTSSTPEAANSPFLGERKPALSTDQLLQLKEAASGRQPLSAQGVHFSRAHIDQIVESAHYNLRDGKRSPNFHTLDFRECTFDAPVFETAVVQHPANFGGCIFFIDPALIDEQSLVSASFGATVFEDGANFTGTRFEGSARFDRCSFRGQALFRSVRIHGRAEFYASHFENVSFRQAAFKGPASFQDAGFSQDAEFGGVIFSEEANFVGSEFAGRLQLGSSEPASRAIFARTTSFEGATFSGSVQVVGSGGPSEFNTNVAFKFARTSFPPGAQIDLRNVGSIDFSTCEFAEGCIVNVGRAGYEVTDEERLIDFRECQFNGPVRIAVSGNGARLRRTTVKFDRGASRDDLSINVVDGTISMREFVSRSRCIIRGENGSVSDLDGTSISSFVFENVDLTRCRLSGAYGLGSAEFAGDTSFEVVRSGRRGSRRRIREERELPSPLTVENRSEAVRAESTYRSLRHAFESSSNSPGANDFYFGEMLVRKRVAGVDGELGTHLVLSAYQLMSGFSTRPARAALFSLLAFVVASLFVAENDNAVGGVFANIFGPLATLEQQVKMLFEKLPVLDRLAADGGNSIGYAVASLALILMLPQLFFSLRAQVKR